MVYPLPLKVSLKSSNLRGPMLTIGQIAAEMGIRASAIRYYESEGLLPVPNRRSGWRVYDRSVLDRLALIELGKECGLSISEIRKLLNGFARNPRPASRWRSLAETKLKELDEKMLVISRMRRVLKAIARCECRSIQECAAWAHQRSRTTAATR